MIMPVRAICVMYKQGGFPFLLFCPPAPKVQNTALFLEKTRGNASRQNIGSFSFLFTVLLSLELYENAVDFWVLLFT